MKQREQCAMMHFVTHQLLGMEWNLTRTQLEEYTEMIVQRMQDTEAEKNALEQKIIRLNKLILVSSSVVPSQSMRSFEKRRQQPSQSSSSTAGQRSRGGGGGGGGPSPSRRGGFESGYASSSSSSTRSRRRQVQPSGTATDVEDSRGDGYGELSDADMGDVASFMIDSEDESASEVELMGSSSSHRHTNGNGATNGNGNYLDDSTAIESDSSSASMMSAALEQQQQHLLRALQLKEEHQQTLLQNIQTLNQSLGAAREANQIKDRELSKRTNQRTNQAESEREQRDVVGTHELMANTVSQTLQEREKVMQQLVESKIEGASLTDLVKHYVDETTLRVRCWLRMPPRQEGSQCLMCVIDATLQELEALRLQVVEKRLEAELQMSDNAYLSQLVIDKDRAIAYWSAMANAQVRDAWRAMW